MGANCYSGNRFVPVPKGVNHPPILKKLFNVDDPFREYGASLFPGTNGM